MAGATVALAAASVEVAAVWDVPLLLEEVADSAAADIAAADIAAAEVLAADSVVVRIDRAEVLRLLITTTMAAAAIITEADIAEAA